MASSSNSKVTLVPAGQQPTAEEQDADLAAFEHIAKPAGVAVEQLCRGAREMRRRWLACSDVTTPRARSLT